MEQFQILPIAKVFESPLNPRKHFNQKKMEELIESIRARGILVPLLVRPCKDSRIAPLDQFEIAAGHRRYRAAIKAELKEVPLIIREMSDSDFLETLIIENDKHENLEPLEQAQGYRTLMEEMHYDVATLSVKVAKSESWIYQRMKLLELIPEAQKLLYEEKITAGHAILIARLQPDEQREVLLEIRDDDRMSVRDLADYIETNIHLDLNSASFKKNDPDLVPEAGPCTTCPKRTGSAPALFPEIKKKDTCTDPGCFRQKVEAFTDQWLEKQSQDSDIPPLRLSNRYESRSPKKLPEDPEKPISPNLYREITDKKKDGCSSAREGIVVEGHHPGRILTVCVDPECEKHHANPSYDGAGYKAQQRAGEEKRKLAFKIREAILDAILEAWSGPYSKEDLLLLAKEFYDPIWNDSQKKILVRKGLKPKKEQYTQNTRAPMHEWLAKQTAEELHVFLLEIALFRLLEGHGRDGKRDPLIETAKRYGVDPRKIEAKFRAEVKTKKAEKMGKKKKGPSVKQKAKREDPPKVRTIPMKFTEILHGPSKKKGEPKAGVCRECGCTETTPCEGGCAWTDKTKTVCTACKMAKEHLWEKQNLVTVGSAGKVGMHDIYKCKKCGTTGKRFGVGPIRRDEKFAKLEECPGPKKEVQTSTKEK